MHCLGCARRIVDLRGSSPGQPLNPTCVRAPCLGLVCVFRVPAVSAVLLPPAQVPSEILSLETRSAGYSLVTFMNFIMTFVVGQSFLSMLCAFRVSSSSPILLE